MMRMSRRYLKPAFVLVIIAAWLFFLRWPHFDRPAWNLDEGIHATIARTILDGGVMYRDAIDQRTPLSYYLVALSFAAIGENNMWRLHALLTAMIAATAFGLFWPDGFSRNASCDGLKVDLGLRKYWPDWPLPVERGR
jgi:4-amino-4-deoxy-L-arabinose transferase-like glycosyltransferase